MTASTSTPVHESTPDDCQVCTTQRTPATAEERAEQALTHHEFQWHDCPDCGQHQARIGSLCDECRRADDPRDDADAVNPSTPEA